jgi:hypothetical protein
VAGSSVCSARARCTCNVLFCRFSFTPTLWFPTRVNRVIDAASDRLLPKFGEVVFPGMRLPVSFSFLVLTFRYSGKAKLAPEGQAPAAEAVPPTPRLGRTPSRTQRLRLGLGRPAPATACGAWTPTALNGCGGGCARDGTESTSAVRRTGSWAWPECGDGWCRRRTAPRRSDQRGRGGAER